MNLIEAIRKEDASILVLGNHPKVIQSILDFDFLSNKRKPSIKALVTSTKKTQKFFFGTKEILIPCVPSLEEAREQFGSTINWMLNLQSGRRAYASTVSFFTLFPKSRGGHIFAENVPEQHALSLIHTFSSNYLLVGPSGVGLLVPGALKLGAIGGIDAAQITEGNLTLPGNIAVGSTSGGMTNELIRAVVASKRQISFAIAIGGDRFPALSVTDVFTLAERDPKTKAFVYFGELGGVDEYEIIELLQNKKFTKPIVAYIAGSIDEAFDEHMQFGHAKALVRTQNESARAKREALRAVGVVAPDTFGEFLKALQQLPQAAYTDAIANIEPLMKRQPSILSTRTILDLEATQPAVKRGKLLKKEVGSFVSSILTALLGHEAKSAITLSFADQVFALSIDHGGHVSGAVNTMITARAGRDLVTSLTSGLLTIGPRFGGAINTAAGNWYEHVTAKIDPAVFIEKLSREGVLIAGIGHKKYRVGLPDPRVESLSQFASLLKKHPHYDFARAVEKITTTKNGSLILNVDGVIAALLLDILVECEGFKRTELKNLIEAELFNAFFVIPRTVGFIGHFLEQKQNDEGLFRLPDDLLYTKDARKSPLKKGKKK